MRYIRNSVVTVDRVIRAAIGDTIAIVQIARVDEKEVDVLFEGFLLHERDEGRECPQTATVGMMRCYEDLMRNAYTSSLVLEATAFDAQAANHGCPSYG